MITLTALIAAAVVASAPVAPMSLDTVIETLQPHLDAASEAFPGCDANLKRVVIVGEIADDDDGDGGTTFGMFRDRKIYLSAQMMLHPEDFRRHVIFHEFAHCERAHLPGGFANELMAESMALTKLLYRPEIRTGFSFPTAWSAP